MVRDVKGQIDNPDQVSVVKEFLNVFPKELRRFPPDREIKFSIDVVLGT